MHHFAYRDGVLHAEDLPLSVIAEAVGTPVYVYSRATLERHARVFREALDAVPDKLIAFAVKSDSTPSSQWPKEIDATAIKGVVTGFVLNVPSKAASKLPRIRRAAIHANKNCIPGSGKNPTKEPAKTPRATRWGSSGRRLIRCMT